MTGGCFRGEGLLSGRRTGRAGGAGRESGERKQEKEKVGTDYDRKVRMPLFESCDRNKGRYRAPKKVRF